MKQEIDPSHGRKRSVLRFIGPVVLLTGIAFTATAFIDFVMAVNGSGEPDKFWCAFIGMPLMFFGAVFTSMGFMGSMHRYVASETAPVAKDTVNYLAHGTKEGVQTVATAIGAGLRSGMQGETATKVLCHKCNQSNAADAKFCSHCGAGIGKTKACPSCNELNDPDARFCDDCGKPLGAE